MSGITDYLKALWMGFISLPVILVSIQFLATQFNLSRFGVFITLYKGVPLSINYIVRWLLLSEPEALHGYNFWAIVITWSIGWLFISDWVRNIRANISGIFSTYLLYILYLALYHRIALKFLFPDSFIPLFGAFVTTIIIYYLRRFKRTKTFFEKLREAGIKLPEAYFRKVKLPIVCNECGAIILSNSKYCWRCGKDLEQQ